MVEDEEAPIRSEEMLENEPKRGLIGFVSMAVSWFRMLAKEMHWSFVFGVLMVYGVSQGLGGALVTVGTEYYMKDVQKVQPSESQVYIGLTGIPWLVKPLWGLLTDVVPVAGYHRRPYFVFAGKITVCLNYLSFLVG